MSAMEAFLGRKPQATRDLSRFLPGTKQDEYRVYDDLWYGALEIMSDLPEPGDEYVSDTIKQTLADAEGVVFTRSQLANAQRVERSQLDFSKRLTGRNAPVQPGMPIIYMQPLAFQGRRPGCYGPFLYAGNDADT